MSQILTHHRFQGHLAHSILNVSLAVRGDGTKISSFHTVTLSLRDKLNDVSVGALIAKWAIHLTQII